VIVTRRTLTVSAATVRTKGTGKRGHVLEMEIAGIARIATGTDTGIETVTVTGVAATEAAVVIVIEGVVIDGTVVDHGIVVVPEIVAAETGIVILNEDHEMLNGTLLLLQMKRINPRIRMGM
jgi:hypothetical protein